MLMPLGLFSAAIAPPFRFELFLADPPNMIRYRIHVDIDWMFVISDTPYRRPITLNPAPELAVNDFGYDLARTSWFIRASVVRRACHGAPTSPYLSKRPSRHKVSFQRNKYGFITPGDHTDCTLRS